MKPATSNIFKMLIPHAISDPPIATQYPAHSFYSDNEASEEKEGGLN